MKLRFTPDGAALAEDFAPIDSMQQRMMSHMRNTVRMKVDLLTWRCGCKHEQRLQKYCEEGGDVGSDAFPLVVFCPEQVRANYANCAHVEGQGRDPDPFGPEIRSLIAISFLDEATWTDWLKKMRFSILAVDGIIGRAAMPPSQEHHEPLPDGMTAEALQEANIAELQNKGRLLLELLGRSGEE